MITEAKQKRVDKVLKARPMKQIPIQKPKSKKQLKQLFKSLTKSTYQVKSQTIQQKEIQHQYVLALMFIITTITHAVPVTAI